MKIDAGNVRAKIVGATDDERAWLERYLSYETKSYNGGSWATERRSFVTPGGSFPAGFVALVRKKSLHPVEIRDLSPLVDAWSEEAVSRIVPELREHQRAGLDKVRTHRRGLFRHSTGSGKGTLIVAIGLCVPIRWIVLVHRATLLAQVCERFQRYTGETIGEISSGKFAPARITVAMVKTCRSLMKAKKHKDFFDAVEGVMFDEAHLAGGPEVRRVLDALPNAAWRYGFSGTPTGRGDHKNLHVIGAFGPVIHRVDAAELVAKGVIAAAKVRLVPVRHTPVNGEWRDVYETAVVRDPDRLEVLVGEIVAAPKPAFVFVTALAHGRAVEDALLAAGIQAEFVWGEKSPQQRAAALDRLRTGIVEVIVTNKIMQEGVDVVGLRGVVYGAGGKSVIAQLQSLGRGSRATEGKSDFAMVDVWDVDCGCMGKDHWSCRVLRRHAAQRRETYEREGYEVTCDPMPPRLASAR